jgi:glycosyltransferase involved in cell wall biosynthesis
MAADGVGCAWVGNELRIVRKSGIPFALNGLYKPTTRYFAAEDIAVLERETQYLYPLRKWRVARDVVLAPARFGTRFFAALGNALFGERESLSVRAVAFWHLLVACHWAAMLKDRKVSHIHSQWIHSGGTVAMYGAWLLGAPFSFTGHAVDLFRDRAALADKIRRADFIVCISEFHRQFYLQHGADPAKLIIAYCGIDTRHFSPVRRPRAPGAPYRILSSGRLVAKKGFDVLIRACALLRDRGLDFRCVIAGSGPDEAALRAQVAAAGLGDRVTLTGKALLQEEIPAFMGSGDVYALPCVWAPDNDVDGLPQMLMEAMACGLPAVSTRLVGIPDLVRHEETGLLAESGDAAGLADALMRLEADPALADRLAEAGRRRVIDVFDLDRCLEPLLDRFRARLESAP